MDNNQQLTVDAVVEKLTHCGHSKYLDNPITGSERALIRDVLAFFPLQPTPAADASETASILNQQKPGTVITGDIKAVELGKIGSPRLTEALERLGNLTPAADASEVVLVMDEVLIWLRAALNCKSWHWDGDQKAAAQDCHDRAKKILPALQPQQWLPIEGAPRDGAEIQLATSLRWNKMALDKKEPRIGRGFYAAGAFWWDERLHVWRNRLGQFIASPTHWMPLPSAPKQEG